MTAAAEPDVDITDADAYADGIPHEVFARMRREEPIARRLYEGRPFWAVTRYADLVTITRDAATYSSATGRTNLPDLTEVQHRLLFAQVLEAVRALEEGVLEDIREGDVGAILGWGFCPWSGGPFSWLDILGAGQAVAICDRLTACHGARFTAPPLLRDMAAKGDSFYGRFAQAAVAA